MDTEVTHSFTTPPHCYPAPIPPNHFLIFSEVWRERKNEPGVKIYLMFDVLVSLSIMENEIFIQGQISLFKVGGIWGKEDSPRGRLKGYLA